MWTRASELTNDPSLCGSSQNSKEKSSGTNIPRLRLGETPLEDINQAAIDAAAIALHPNVTPASRNVYVYTPVSAILRYAIPDWGTLRRPKGAKGQVRTDHINPTDAAAIIAAAESFDLEFALLLRFLL
jgi:hypothetical protein